MIFKSGPISFEISGSWAQHGDPCNLQPVASEHGIWKRGVVESGSGGRRRWRRTEHISVCLESSVNIHKVRTYYFQPLCWRALLNPQPKRFIFFLGLRGMSGTWSMLKSWRAFRGWGAWPNLETMWRQTTFHQQDPLSETARQPTT